ncbi:MAG: Ig-like surface protein [Thermoleophilia bacterium]|nr:Ig-like surface protein [Thermoleophilia bacterium]
MLSRPLLPACLAIIALLAIAPAAHAAYTLKTSPSYVASNLPTGTNHQLGQADQNGVFYTMAGNTIFRYDKNGVRLANIPLTGLGVANARDIAPSPDGAYLYLSQGGNTPVRLNRVGAVGSTTYAKDATWKLQQFSVWNVKWTPVGHAIATDGRGDIYVSNSSWWVNNTQNSVAKFAPDGTSITAFGDYGKEAGNWITNQDIAVSRDGRRVYVGENCGKSCIYTSPDYQGSRVTRYDYVPGGKYRYSRVVSAQGPMDGNAFPRCESAGATHSAYTLAMDAWDNLYASSTTCGRIQKFATFADPAKDKFIESIAVYTDPATADGIDGARNHYLASDWAGRIYADEWDRVLTPTTIRIPQTPLPALAPLPLPDVTAPVLANVVTPATTTTRDVTVAITATDDQAVGEMRLANEDGAWGPWQPFATPVTHQLSANFAVKGIYVQVRDFGGNLSATVYRTLRYEAAPVIIPGEPVQPAPPAGVDVADPIITKVTVPALTATREINIGIEATDDVALRRVRFANEDGTWAAWEAFANSKPWTLSAGFTNKVVYVQVSDTSGRTSNVVTAKSKIAADAPVAPPAGGGEGAPAAPDTTAPVLVKVTLPKETTTQAVAVAIDATDAVGVAQVRFANEDGTWTAWQPFTNPKTWTLTAGYTPKLVYVQVRDAVGNESLVLTSTTKYVKTVAGPVDNAAPVLTAITIANPTPTAAVTVKLTATDDVAVTQVRFANEDGNWGAWGAFAAEVPHTLTVGNTNKVVYGQVRDAAGRESAVLFTKTLVKP